MCDLSGKRPSSFLEVFLPNFSGEKLKIPPRFIKHMEGKTSGSVLLMGPSGNIWHANLVKDSDDLFLHDGWPTFVKDHSIQCGDSLVFSYEGNLCFTVQIFDQSSCEKEQAFCVTCSQKPSDCNGLERKREREEEKLYADPTTDSSPKKLRNISTVMLNCPEDWEMKMTVRTVEGCHPDEQDDGGKDIQASSPSLEEKLTDASEKTIVLAMPASDMREKYICHSNKIKKVETTEKKSKIMEVETTEKKKKATKNEFRVSACIEERVTRHFTSSFPYFVKVMNWSHIIKGSLNIPAKFSNIYLPKCRTKIVLHNEKGDRWTVNSIPVSRNKRRYTLSGGWIAFVRDNVIKMEDICIFELVGDCEMSVRIVRLGMEGLDNQIDQGASGDEIKGYQHQRSYEYVAVEDLYDGLRPREEGTIMTEAWQDTSYSIDVEGLDNKKDQGAAGYDLKEYQHQSSYEIVTMEDLYHGSGTREEGTIMTEASQNTSNNIDTKANTLTPVDPTLSLESEFADIKNDEHVASSSGVATPDQRRKQVGRARRSLAAQLVDEGTEAAHSFTSPYPNFMKIMTLPNARSKYVLRIPSDFARVHFPVNKTELVLRNPTGNCWTVNLLHDRSCWRHVLSGGWLSFVRANNIKSRDVCVFELVDQREFQVHIFRTTQQGVNSQSNDNGADGSIIDADSTRL